MEIRATQKEDWQLLKQIRLAALQDTPTAFGVSYETAAADSDAQWQVRAAGERTRFWLAFDDDRPVGLVGGGFRDAIRYELIAMWVEPAARGAGVADALVTAVKSRAVALGLEALFLEVAAENVRAVQFYLRHGFVFMDEWEPIDSHPHILAQSMRWRCG
ncbi:GNAT family N-acetyltransferase [Pseudomonas sp. G34]|uniref:GNAT family N-acetyltransferase n=1 Tax=Pseudomonas sp. G34 TaxID=3059083 RepID=UPI002809935A|nr:GNAT family N-acetyltransferase [Pseudomonas sp. G34]MDQ7986536.1 GNAT family N-acetyltransferase [Pseudomonas sp. G34]